MKFNKCLIFAALSIAFLACSDKADSAAVDARTISKLLESANIDWEQIVPEDAETDVPEFNNESSDIEGSGRQDEQYSSSPSESEEQSSDATIRPSQPSTSSSDEDWPSNNSTNIEEGRPSHPNNSTSEDGSSPAPENHSTDAEWVSSSAPHNHSNHSEGPSTLPPSSSSRPSSTKTSTPSHQYNSTHSGWQSNESTTRRHHTSTPKVSKPEWVPTMAPPQKPSESGKNSTEHSSGKNSTHKENSPLKPDAFIRFDLNINVNRNPKQN